MEKQYYNSGKTSVQNPAHISDNSDDDDLPSFINHETKKSHEFTKQYIPTDKDSQGEVKVIIFSLGSGAKRYYA